MSGAFPFSGQLQSWHLAVLCARLRSLFFSISSTPCLLLHHSSFFSPSVSFLIFFVLLLLYFPTFLCFFYLCLPLELHLFCFSSPALSFLILVSRSFFVALSVSTLFLHFSLFLLPLFFLSFPLISSTFFLASACLRRFQVLFLFSMHFSLAAFFAQYWVSASSLSPIARA